MEADLNGRFARVPLPRDAKGCQTEEVAISNRNQIFSVRPAEPHDGSAISALKYALQVEEGNKHAIAPNAELWIERLFGPDRQFEALVAEHRSRIVGILLFNLKYYTGWPEPAVYVQDLFVESAFRRKGIALQLLGHLAAYAKRQNAAHMELVVHAQNPARHLYEYAGFVGVEEALTYVAGRAMITELAKRGVDSYESAESTERAPHAG